MPGLREHTTRFLDHGFSVAFGLCAVLALIPIWYFQFIPQVDLPLFADLARIFRDYPGPNNDWASILEIRWTSPYIVTIALAGTLAKVLPLHVAMKVVISLGVLGLPLSIWFLLRELERDRWWSLWGFVLAFGFPFYWGLLHYQLALPIGISIWACGLAFHRTNSKTWLAVFVIVGVLLCFTHLMLFAFFTGSFCAWTVFGGLSKTERKLTAGVCSLLLLAVPLLASGTRGLETERPVFATVVHRLFSIPGNLAGDASLQRLPDLLFGAMLLGGLYLGIRHQKSWSWASAIPCIFVLGLVSCAPQRWGIHTLMSERSVILFFPAALLCVGEFENPTPRRFMRVVVLIAALAVIPIQSFRFAEFNAQAQFFQSLTAKLEPGQHALSLVSIDIDNAERTQPLQHVASWYAAEKNGWAERTTLALPHFPIHYKQVSPTEERWQIEDALKTFSWKRYPKLNYLFTYSDSAEQSNAWAAQGGAGELVAEDGKWRAYRRK